MDVGESHLRRAKSAARPSYWALRFSADWEIVSCEARLAANAFKSCSAADRQADSLRLCVEAESNLHRPFGAARALEQLAELILKHPNAASSSRDTNCYKTGVAAQLEEALEIFSQAVNNYKLSAKNDEAISVLYKIAELREKDGGSNAIEQACAAYDEALQLRLAEDSLHYASEIFRSYLALNIRCGQIEKAITTSFRHAECLQKLKQIDGVHKAILTVAVLFLRLNQPEEAEQSLSSTEAIQSHFLGSTEFAAAAEAIDAYKSRDGPKFSKVLNDQAFQFLHPLVVSITRQLASEALTWPTGDAKETLMQEESIDHLLC